MDGFELTYHDPLLMPNDRHSYQRMIDRLDAIRGREDVIPLYNHWRSRNSDLSALRVKLQEFASFCTGPGAKGHIVLFQKSWFLDALTPKLGGEEHGDAHVEYVPYTTSAWSGSDMDVFWSRVDDDPIQLMLEDASTAFSPEAER